MDLPTTGIDELDSALGGLFWGDDVMYEVDETTSPEPFYAAAAASADSYDYAAYVAFGRDLPGIRRRFPGLEVIDAGPGAPLGRPGALLGELRRGCVRGRRCLVLFDPLEVAGDRWGHELATRFFSQTCPALLEAGAIAYWSLHTALVSRAARQTIKGVTQCVLDLSDGHLRIVKAEGRPPGIEGSVYRCDVNGAVRCSRSRPPPPGSAARSWPYGASAGSASGIPDGSQACRRAPSPRPSGVSAASPWRRSSN